MRRRVKRLNVQQCQISSLPYFDRADLFIETHCSRAVDELSLTPGAPVKPPHREALFESVQRSAFGEHMRRLLQGAPSAPSETEIPRLSISNTGANPEPSLRFDEGQ